MPTNSQKRLCVAALMKCERPYIMEWVAWYRLLGFEIMIADNGGDDGQTSLLLELEAAGLIRRFDIRHMTEAPQVPAYRLMFDAARASGVDYIAFFDADEFFEPLGVTVWKGSAATLLHDLFTKTGAAALGFNWMCFGNSYRTKRSPEPVIQRFTRAAHIDFETNRHIKSVLNIGKCCDLLEGQKVLDALHPHGIVVDEAEYCHDGASCRFLPGLSMVEPVRWNNARIRHYVVKSDDEYANIKAKRGQSVGGTPSPDYFAIHNRNDVDAPLSTEIIALVRESMTSIERKLHWPTTPFKRRFKRLWSSMTGNTSKR
jgi:glycosyltransferase involved in cell wall biosynthesis